MGAQLDQLNRAAHAAGFAFGGVEAEVDPQQTVSAAPRSQFASRAWALRALSSAMRRGNTGADL